LLNGDVFTSPKKTKSARAVGHGDRAPQTPRESSEETQAPAMKIKFVRPDTNVESEKGRPQKHARRERRERREQRERAMQYRHTSTTNPIKRGSANPKN
jgi:hypothetical protein